jgi:hypothetical protein
MDSGKFDWDRLIKWATVVPIAASTFALAFDIGYFYSIDIGWFSFFSISEHVEFALRASPIAFAALIVLALTLNPAGIRSPFVIAMKKHARLLRLGRKLLIRGWVVLLALLVVGELWQAIYHVVIFLNENPHQWSAFLTWAGVSLVAWGVAGLVIWFFWDLESSKEFGGNCFSGNSEIKPLWLSSRVRRLWDQALPTGVSEVPPSYLWWKPWAERGRSLLINVLRAVVLFVIWFFWGLRSSNENSEKASDPFAIWFFWGLTSNESGEEAADPNGDIKLLWLSSLVIAAAYVTSGEVILCSGLVF